MPDDIILYDDQTLAVQELRCGSLQGHRCQVLCAPTGAGKTVIGTFLLKEVQRKQTRATFLVDRVALCAQTSTMLQRYGIRHGVAQADNTFGRLERIQVASAQTIEKREYWPGLDVLIVDECHTMRRKVIEFIQATDARVIGLTATPFTKGLGDVYSRLVNVTTTDQLIANGRLAPLKVYVAKQIDMHGAPLSRGEWRERDIEQRGGKIIGDIVAEWIDKTQRHFGGPVKTIAFSATVPHGDELCRQFQAAGYNFRQVSYKDGNDAKRAALIDEFRRPDSSIIGLVSCEALAKGFDVPDILCGIAARPYRKSFASHIQQIGRAMRAFPGKRFALWLDHAGNYLGFYDQMKQLFALGVQGLDQLEWEPKVREETNHLDSDIACSGCGYAPLLKEMTECPVCGHVRKRRNLVEIVPGRMIEVDGLDTVRQPFLKDPAEVWQQLCALGLWRWPQDEQRARKYAQAQFKNIYHEWPPRGVAFDPCDIGEVEPALEALVKQNLLRWIRSRENAA